MAPTGVGVVQRQEVNAKAHGGPTSQLIVIQTNTKGKERMMEAMAMANKKKASDGKSKKPRVRLASACQAVLHESDEVESIAKVNDGDDDDSVITQSS